MENKTYVIVCSCSGRKLKAYESLEYYYQLRRLFKKRNRLFKNEKVGNYKRNSSR